VKSDISSWVRLFPTRLQNLTRKLYFYFFLNFHIQVYKVLRSILYHVYFYKVINKQFDGLNIGSSNSRISTFCNIDANPLALCDIVSGVDTLKLNSQTVGAIYNSHIFEHIPSAKSKKVLQEWYRVLRSGGKLYICVPDLEVLFKIYLDNLSQYHTEKGRYLVNLSCAVTYGGQTNKYDFHYNGYSFITLKYLLEEVGFTNVQTFDRSQLKLGEFIDASFAKIDDVPISLNVEAIK